MEIFRVALFGHREIPALGWIEDRLEATVLELLRTKEFVEFYLGRNGTFDLAAASAVKRAQKKWGKENSALILVLPYDVKDSVYYRDYYDEILYPLDEKTHFKAAITKRNQWMTEHADLLIVYVDHPSGGAYRAYRYGQALERPILNLSEIPI